MIDNNRVDNSILNNSTPDYNVDREGDTLTTDETEPATAHDVGIGGGIGAVGGAVVGALAGGPVGAVIGAIAGGAASAGAVDVVDKHDHDYARTVSTDDTTTIGTAPVGTETSYATGYASTPGVSSTTGAYADPTGAYDDPTIATDPMDEDELDRDVSLDHPNRLTR